MDKIIHIGQLAVGVYTDWEDWFVWANYTLESDPYIIRLSVGLLGVNAYVEYYRGNN